MKLVIIITLIATIGCASASNYGINAVVTGSLTVNGNTVLSQNVQIGTSSYMFPSTPPSSASQVLTSSTSSSPFVLEWTDSVVSDISTDISSTGTSIVISGTGPSLTVAGIKAGNGISVTGPTSGDVIISSSILQTSVVYPIVFHPTGARPNPQSFPWPGWSSLVPSLSTSTAPSSCVLYGSGANTVTCDITNNSGSGTPQCVSGNNNDISFTSANPVASTTCSSTFTNTLAGNTLQRLSLSCSGNIFSILLVCTI
jgi:hypothetical protein